MSKQHIDESFFQLHPLTGCELTDAEKASLELEGEQHRQKRKLMCKIMRTLPADMPLGQAMIVAEERAEAQLSADRSDAHLLTMRKELGETAGPRPVLV